MKDFLNSDVAELLMMCRKYKKGVEVVEATPDQITLNILNKNKGEQILLRVTLFYNKEESEYYLKDADKIAWAQLMDSFEPDYHVRTALMFIREHSRYID